MLIRYVLVAGLISSAGLVTACAGTEEIGHNDDSSSDGGASAQGNGGAVGDGGGDAAGGAGGSSGTGGSHEACGPSDGIVLAMDELFLGDTSFAHVTSTDAWREFGFNLDGQTTSVTVSDHCLPAAGGSTASFADGDGGRDNSFGRNLIPLLTTFQSDLPEQANQTITSGQFTMMLFLEGLEEQTTVAELSAHLYSGAPLMDPPSWDGDDCWPVTYESVSNPDDVLSSKVTFDTASLTNDIFDSNGTDTVVLPLRFLNFVAPVTIYHARLSTKLAPLHDGAALGQIGGVLDTEEFVEVVRDVIGSLDSNLCSGTTVDSVITQIRQASDIMKDGTQDPGATCDGISVGLGFTMLAAKLGGVAEPASLQTDPCP